MILILKHKTLKPPTSTVACFLITIIIGEKLERNFNLQKNNIMGSNPFCYVLAIWTRILSIKKWTRTLTFLRVQLGSSWRRNGDFFLIFAKTNYQNNLLMLCKNLRSAAKNSHTGLFFRPRGVALVKSPFIYKQKGKGHEHKGSYPFPWRRNGDFFLIFAKANYLNNLLMLCKNLRSAAKNSHTDVNPKSWTDFFN